jgi:hypothetical protein
VCSGDYRLSKREIELPVEDFFGIPIALGSIGLNSCVLNSRGVCGPSGS